MKEFFKNFIFYSNFCFRRGGISGKEGKKWELEFL